KFIDPDGMGVNDIYALDNMTGAIEFVEEQEGDDVLIDKQTNDVIDGSVERGILKDGMNIEKDGLQTSKVGEGTNLVVNISMHVGKEVTGTVYENSEGEQMLNVMSYDKAETYRDKDDRRIVTGMGTGYSSEIIQGL